MRVYVWRAVGKSGMQLQAYVVVRFESHGFDMSTEVTGWSDRASAAGGGKFYLEGGVVQGGTRLSGRIWTLPENNTTSPHLTSAALPWGDLEGQYPSSDQRNPP